MKLSEVVVPILASKWTWILSLGLLFVAAGTRSWAVYVCILAANLLGYFEGVSRQRAEQAVRERREVLRASQGKENQGG